MDVQSCAQRLKELTNVWVDTKQRIAGHTVADHRSLRVTTHTYKELVLTHTQCRLNPGPLFSYSFSFVRARMTTLCTVPWLFLFLIFCVGQKIGADEVGFGPTKKEKRKRQRLNAQLMRRQSIRLWPLMASACCVLFSLCEFVASCIRVAVPFQGMHDWATNSFSFYSFYQIPDSQRNKDIIIRDLR